MRSPVRSLLDANALLAVLTGEDGRRDVMDAILKKAAILSVQWAEVAHIIVESGGDPGTVEPDLRDLGITPDRLHVIDWTQRMATMYARVRSALEPHLSIGFADYAALAGALVLDVPLLTSDSKLAWVDVGAKVTHFRPWDRAPRPAGVPARVSIR